MKQRFILFRRAGVFYCEDTTNGKQMSLRTRDRGEALILLHAQNESVRQPVCLDKIPSVVDSGLTDDGFGYTSWFANRIPHKICWWQSNQTQNRPILTAHNRRRGITLDLGEFTGWALAVRPES